MIIKVTYEREVEDINEESALEKVMYELKNGIIDEDGFKTKILTDKFRRF